MYSQEERKRAIDLYIKYDKCASDVVHELGREYMYGGCDYRVYQADMSDGSSVFVAYDRQTMRKARYAAYYPKKPKGLIRSMPFKDIGAPLD